MLSGQYDFGAGDGSVQDPLRAGLHVVDPDPVAAVAGVAEHEQLLGLPAVMADGDRADGALHRRQRPVELHRHGVIQTQFGHTALRHGIAADGVIGLAVLPFVQHSERHHRIGLFGIARFTAYPSPLRPVSTSGV